MTARTIAFVALCVALAWLCSSCPMADALDGHPVGEWQVAITEATNIYTTLTEVAIIEVPPEQVYEVGSIMITAIRRTGLQVLIVEMRSSDGTWRTIAFDGNTSSMPGNGSALILDGHNNGGPEYISAIPRIIATDLRVLTHFSQTGGHVETIVTYRRVQ